MDAALVARRFGLGGRSRLSDGPVARGKEGVVWRLETGDGLWAVKVPFERATEDDVRRSTLFQEAARRAGVPTPQVRRTSDGQVFADIADQQVRVYEWVDLLAPDTRLDPTLVGEVLARIHQVPSVAPPDAFESVGPVDAWYTEPVGADRWDELVELLGRAGAPFAGRLAELRDELVALETWVEPPSVVQMCHCDLWADNLLPTATGGVCVIDWENSGGADPSQELGCVLFEFARGDPARAATLMAAYRAAGGPGSISRRGHFSMLIAQLGHITETAATDWLDPNPRTPERSDAEAWIREVLDEPHTREALGSLLAAASGALD